MTGDRQSLPNSRRRELLPPRRFSQHCGDSIAAVAHVIATFGRCEQVEGRRDERHDVVEAARPRRAQERFQLRECELDGVEIRSYTAAETGAVRPPLRSRGGPPIVCARRGYPRRRRRRAATSAPGSVRRTRRKLGLSIGPSNTAGAVRRRVEARRSPSASASDRTACDHGATCRGGFGHTDVTDQW